jgi:hypothetical protein
MKFKIIILIHFLLLPSLLFSQLSEEQFIHQVTIEKIKKHIDTLASETMEGRMTGEYGQKLAARYIADHFEKNNLKTYFPNNPEPYYQKFTLNSLQTGHSKMYYKEVSYNAPVFFSNKAVKDSIVDEVVFAGYAKKNELEGLEIDNKSIFFFSESVKSSIDKAIKISDDYGTKTFIIGLPFGKRINEKLFEKEITDLHTFYELFYFYNYYAKEKRNNIDYKKFRQSNLMVPDLKINTDHDIHILFVPEELCEGLFNDQNRKLKDFKKLSRSNNQLKTISHSVFAYSVDFNPQVTSIDTENVVGFFDCKHTDETIIIGAHYDHIGRNPNGSINYGADDNASGVCMLLLLSDTFSKLAEQGLLTKDIVLIAYTAEEMGLLGSEYFSDHPIIPLSNVNVVINADMIGRDKDDDPENSNRLFILEWKGGKKYIRNIHKINKEYTHLILDNKPGTEYKNLWTYGSDHYSFLKKDISCVTFFTGLHRDYHTSKDIPEKINFDKLNRIIQLIILNTIEISADFEID